MGSTVYAALITTVQNCLYSNYYTKYILYIVVLSKFIEFIQLVDVCTIYRVLFWPPNQPLTKHCIGNIQYNLSVL